MTDYK